MISITKKSGFAICNVWINEKPFDEHTFYKQKDIYFKANDLYFKNSQNIIIELIQPPMNYAMLGYSYTYSQSDILKISIKLSNDNVLLYNERSRKYEKVYRGIEEEYCQVISDCVVHIMKNSKFIPPGNLNFNIGAYSEITSNNVAFAKVTEMLMKTFITNDNNFEKIINEELEKPIKNSHNNIFR